MENKKNILTAIILYPLSVIYSLIIYIRNRLFDYNIILGTKEFDIPIISVGNITVGGTGKTPHIEYLVKILKENYKIATLSRGYRRKTKGYVLATETSNFFEIGDEPRQIKNKFPELVVSVDEKRVRGVTKLIDTFKEDLDAILLDDAFQHRSIKPGLSILLVDYTQPMFDDQMLPYGRLRENRHEKRRANIIVVTKTPRNLKPIEKRILVKNLNIYPYQNLYFTTMTYGSLKPVFGGIGEKSIFDKLSKGSLSLLVFTGIGRPESMLDYLKKEISQDLNYLRFPDHHNFTKADLEKIRKEFEQLSSKNKLIITTEKDATRLTDITHKEIISDLPVVYLPMNITFLGDDEKDFDNQIVNYVKKNKGNNQLHSKSD
jgi:tetraacyldisaccharide 4'-kinase